MLFASDAAVPAKLSHLVEGVRRARSPPHWRKIFAYANVRHATISLLTSQLIAASVNRHVPKINRGRPKEFSLPQGHWDTAPR
jgi:adenylate cyclase